MKLMVSLNIKNTPHFLLNRSQNYKNFWCVMVPQRRTGTRGPLTEEAAHGTPGTTNNGQRTCHPLRL